VGVTLALAGEKGGFSLEDFLGAGAIVNYLPKGIVLSDAAQTALLAYRRAEGSLFDIVKQGKPREVLGKHRFRGRRGILRSAKQIRDCPLFEKRRHR